MRTEYRRVLVKDTCRIEIKKMLQEAEKFVERVAPMNLILDIQLLYNTIGCCMIMDL